MSTLGQSLDSQVDALTAAGAVRVYQEHASGATQARQQWLACLDLSPARKHAPGQRPHAAGPQHS
ncbi:recombinase family protein [Arthrobacter sp. UYCu712]|uniref:recombinase family protein n=1 Tax=Arthrobacter sp. UYCu712 TaxID=3156340 RepID=UPI003391F8F1